MGFSRQEYWSGLPFSSPGDLPNPGIEPRSPALQADTLTLWATKEALCKSIVILCFFEKWKVYCITALTGFSVPHLRSSSHFWRLLVYCFFLVAQSDWITQSFVSDSATPLTVTHQAPLSMEFSTQEYRSGLPLPSPGDLPDPEIEPTSPTLQADSLPTKLQGKISILYTLI